MSQELFPIMVPRTYKGVGDALDEMRRLKVCEVILSIPWAMIASHEAQAQKNHGQSLGRLADRGGLAPSEAVAILEGRASSHIDAPRAYAQLRQKLDNYLISIAAATEELKDDQALDWISKNLMAIRRDNGSMEYRLRQVVRAFAAGRSAGAQAAKAPHPT